MSGVATRAGRYARAGARWSRLLDRRPPRSGRSRLLRPRSRAGSRRARRRWHREVPAAGDSLPQPSDRLLAPLSRLDVAAARSQSVALARAAASHTAPAQPERRRLSRLGGQRRRTRSTDRFVLCSAPPSTSSTRASSASEPRTSSSPSLAERGRSCTTPSTSGRFTPAEQSPEAGPVLLLGGDQYQPYRLELGLETLAALLPSHPDAQLLVTGRLATQPEPIVERLGLRRHVHFLGRYAQAEAPALFRRAHVLLHTKVNDPCPSLVIEAMAAGLPVVYPRSGGVPELVGDDAGIGVPHPDGFERDEPPSADELADALTRVLADLPALRSGRSLACGRAVRTRALARPSRRAVRALRAAVAANAAAERRELVPGP